jgi:diguanylate cyclase (GGDEF)-like protein
MSVAGTFTPSRSIASIKKTLSVIASLEPKLTKPVNILIQRVNENEVSPEEIDRYLSQIQMQFLNQKDVADMNIRSIETEFQKRLGILEVKSELSARQAEQLAELKKINFKDKNLFLNSITKTLISISEDLVNARKQQSIVVGDEHQHLKKDKNNVTAADVAWSSRAILNNISPVLKALSKQFPENSQVRECLRRCVTMKKQPSVDVYECVGLMEQASRLVTILQSQQASQDSMYLASLNSDLKNIHSTISDMQKGHDNFDSEQSDEMNRFNAKLDNFQELSADATNLPQMKKLMIDNLAEMKLAFLTISENHNRHNAEQKIKLNAAEGSLNTSLAKQKELRNTLESALKNTTIDELTGVGNRRSYNESIKDAEKNYDNSGIETTIIVMDIDRFKRINDEYGHAVGDKALKIIASKTNEILKRASSQIKSDFARYGGEEFVIICSGSSTIKTARLAEIIRKEIERIPFIVSEKKIIITCSLGVASFSKLDHKGESVFKIADHCLYQAKNGGRNQVRVYDKGAAKKVPQNK